MKYYTAGNSCCKPSDAVTGGVDILEQGNTATINAAVTALGQIGYDTTLKKVKVYDGSTPQIQLDRSDINTDVTFAVPLDTNVPSALATKTYIDNSITLALPTIYKKMAANLATTSNTVNTTITDLAIDVVAGKSYWISANIIGQSTVTTTGFTVTMLSVATAAGNLAFTISQGGSSSEGAAGEHQSLIRALGGLAQFGQTNANNQNIMIRINGIFVCTTSGIIAPAFRSEISGSEVRVYEGSILTAIQL